MRLIDADHLKKWILQRWEKAYPHEDLPTREVLEQIDREISYEIVEEDIQKWIPLKGKEPTEDGEYLVSFDDGFVATTGYYDGDFELWADAGEPLAWMPLPEPWKEEKDETNRC